MRGIDMADYRLLCNMFMLALSFSLSSSLYCRHHHHQRHNNIDSRRFYLFIIIIISSSSSSISNTSSRTSSTTTIVLQLVYAPVWCCCCCCCVWFRRAIAFSPLVTCRIGSSSYCYSYFGPRNQYRIWFERNSVARRPSVPWYQFVTVPPLDQ